MGMQKLILFTAPPAFGKTHWLKSHWKSWQGRILYLSPLRAINEEVYRSLLNDSDVFLISSDQKIEQCNEQGPLFISGVETLHCFPQNKREKFLQSLDLVIIDEFHLFYSWGHSFRPQLIEAFFEILAAKKSIIALSATITPQTFSWVEQDLCLTDHQILWINYGNMTVKNRPRRQLYIPSKKLFNIFLFLCLAWGRVKRSSILLFCRYRNEVDSYANKFFSYANILSCKGGEVSSFAEKLNRTGRVDLIIATSCLSHGVNLPQLSMVFINYEEESPEMRLQMLSRGGRRGEAYVTVEYLDLRKYFFRFINRCKRKLKELFSTRINSAKDI